MSIKFLFSIAAVAMFSAALDLHASTPALQNAQAVGDQPPLVRMAGGEVATLREAYITLSVADRDYKGHRVHAMKAIEAACKLLGTDISGEGRGREAQPISDEQLRSVLATVEQVRNSLGNSQPKVVKHLDVAIAQLNIALTIK